MKRRTFLKSTAMAAFGGGMWSSGRASDSARGRLLETAHENIGCLRQGDLVVRVSDERGAPLSAVELRVDQLQHSFLWGGNLFGWANRSNPELEAAYRLRFAELFNYATLDFYWSNYEPEEGYPRLGRTESMLEWCEANGIRSKGHPLVWANLADPPWLSNEAEAIHAASIGRVRGLVSRFRGRIDVWDVVNEPSLLLWADTRLGRWAQNVGTQSFVSQHLRAAREANPGAVLLVNEVLTVYPVYSLLDSLRDQGQLLFNAVGLQSHMHRGAWPLDRMWSLCERYGQLGVPLHFTEFTVLSAARVAAEQWAQPTADSEAAQSESVSEHYTLLFGHPAVQAVSWWDLSDHGAWQGAPAGLLRADMTAKPAYDRLQALIREEWWTSRRGTTNADGCFRCRAFYGRHRVGVRWPDGRETDQEADCVAGGLNEINMSWDRGRCESSDAGSKDARLSSSWIT